MYVTKKNKIEFQQKVKRTLQLNMYAAVFFFAINSIFIILVKNFDLFSQGYVIGWMMNLIPSIVKITNYLNSIGDFDRAYLVGNAYILSWLIFFIYLPVFSVFFCLKFWVLLKNNKDIAVDILGDSLPKMRRNIITVFFVSSLFVISAFLVCYYDFYQLDSYSFMANQVHLRDRDLFRYGLFFACAIPFIGQILGHLCIYLVFRENIKGEK